MDLFGQSETKSVSKNAPLAERVRPKSLNQFFGQQHLVGENAPLRRWIEKDELPSLIFWGPPGSGKTTLAKIIAEMTQASFQLLSAVTSGKAEIKQVIEQAKMVQRQSGKPTILFIDEIHRFNKIQQDAFLPYVEDGTILLIGATTENPSFSIVSPLLSRCKVFALNALKQDEVMHILSNALEDKQSGFGEIEIKVDDEVLTSIAGLADGDARRALNLMEMAVRSAKLQSDGSSKISIDEVKEIAQRDHLIYDRDGEEHYNLISAFIKSMRASDPQAAIYWMTRMLASGEDPLFLTRRMIIFAAEDIGLADPNALTVANQGKIAFEAVGMPEGEIPLAETVLYLATAPKSNASYMALHAAKEEVQKSGSLPVPLHLRNAPTKLMEEMGYKKGYQYDHDQPYHYSGQQCLPDEIIENEFYSPTQFGYEKEIQKRIEWWKKLKSERKDQS